MSTNTIHVSYCVDTTDRGSLFLAFRELKGFDLLGFYHKYCFIRFTSVKLAQESISTIKSLNLTGLVSILPAKHAYNVPYPQPADSFLSSSTLHVTHLPQAYTKIEMLKIFSVFSGFLHANFNGKYAYIYFLDQIHSMRARHLLRTETNLVVSFAKNPPKPDDPSIVIDNSYSKNSIASGSYNSVLAENSYIANCDHLGQRNYCANIMSEYPDSFKSKLNQETVIDDDQFTWVQSLSTLSLEDSSRTPTEENFTFPMESGSLPNLTGSRSVKASSHSSISKGLVSTPLRMQQSNHQWPFNQKNDSNQHLNSLKRDSQQRYQSQSIFIRDCRQQQQQHTPNQSTSFSSSYQQRSQYVHQSSSFKENGYSPQPFKESSIAYHEVTYPIQNFKKNPHSPSDPALKHSQSLQDSFLNVINNKQSLSTVEKITSPLPQTPSQESPSIASHPVPISRKNSCSLSHGELISHHQQTSASLGAKYSWNPLLYGTTSINFGIWNDCGDIPSSV